MSIFTKPDEILMLWVMVFLGSSAKSSNAFQFVPVDPSSVVVRGHHRQDLKGRELHFPSALCSSIANDVDVGMSRSDQEAAFLLPNQSDLQEDLSVPYPHTLSSRGVARVNGGLSVTTAYKLQQFIDETLESSLEEVNNFRIPRAFRFANVLEKGNRWDMLLPFDDDQDGDENKNKDEASSAAVLDAMNELLGEHGKIGPILEQLLGEDAVLYELACLISDPGSNRQEIHPDIVFQQNEIPLIACFVSLQDIDSTMGPTVFIPDTLSEEHHRCINNEALSDGMLQNIPSNISTLNTGDCALYNPMVLHAGGGNESNRRRRLFYFTFLNPSVMDPSNDANPGSINPILKQRNLSLREVQEVLKSQCTSI